MEERIKQIKEKNHITELFSLSPSGFKGDRVFLSENFVIQFFDENYQEGLKYDTRIIVKYHLQDDDLKQRLTEDMYSNILSEQKVKKSFWNSYC